MSRLNPNCQVVRTLDVVGEKWSLLVVRNALRGQTRFSEFKESLGAPTDVLADRLAKLVAAGILDKKAYRAPGERERSSYHLTAKGEGLRVVMAAMVQWGEEFNPAELGTYSRVVRDGAPLRLAYLDPDGREVSPHDVELETPVTAASAPSPA